MRDDTTMPKPQPLSAQNRAQKARRVLAVLLGSFSLVVGLIAPAAPAVAAGPSDGFQPGNIISDASFYDGSAMTAAEVQSFLNQQVPRCTIGDAGRAPGSAWGNTTIASMCVQNLRMTTQSRAADAFCSAYVGATNETGAQIIAKVGKACGISQKALVVMLQKEQGAITDTWPTVMQMDWAMGYACPDTAPCDTQFKGFYNQVYKAAWQLKVYKAYPASYRYQPGRSNPIYWHPDSSCGTSSVYIENLATAGLYIYTPYRPNQAALNAGWGTGDSCSTYGNRNFYNYYKAWFGFSTENLGAAEITKKYEASGGVTGILGSPETGADQYPNGGAGQRFQGGSIYYSPSTGARLVTNPIRASYLSAGSWRGVLGFPAKDVESYPGGALGQLFQGGSIYYSPAGGAHVVVDPVRAAYLSAGSWRGELGFPVQSAVQTQGELIQQFERGSINVNIATGEVRIVPGESESGLTSGMNDEAE